MMPRPQNSTLFPDTTLFRSTLLFRLISRIAGWFLLLEVFPTTLSLAQKRRNQDLKSTRLNSSHDQISYAVFCLKKKKKNSNIHNTLIIALVAVTLCWY